jgi:predicted nucleic acid-binding protein
LFFKSAEVRKIFRQFRDTEVITTTSVIGEVREYIPRLAVKKGLNAEAMCKLLELLPLSVVPEEAFLPALAAATSLIGERDPDDIPLVALALALGCPVISQDNDIRDIPDLQVYTIAETLALLEEKSP